MASERKEVRQSTIDKARRDASEGQRREIVDIGGKGLVLRVQPSGCVWQARVQHRGKPHRVTIGPVDIWSLAHAREASRNIHWHVKSDHGVPDARWMKELHDRLLWADRSQERNGDEDPKDPRPARSLVRPREDRLTSWTFRQARAAWGAHLEVEASAGNLSPETVQNYLGIMGCPAIRTLDDRRVAHITDVDVDMVVQSLVKEGKRSTARDVARVSKRMWKWLYRPANRASSGVARGALDDVEAPKLGDVKKRQRFPKVEQLGLVVATARSGALDPVIGAALELLAWTAQRRLTVACAHVDEFDDWDERPGWGLWRVGHRKVHKDGSGTVAHTVPLPPPAWQRVREHLAWHGVNASGSEWLFPARRDAKLGKPSKAGHLEEGTLTSVLPIIPGAGMSPHDVRRCFSTALSVAGHHLTFIGYVLDHLSLGSVTTRDENGMTRRYTDAQMLAFKTPVMEAWQRLLEPAVQSATLPPLLELRAEIARLRNERRGINKPREKARLKIINDRAYAEGRTHRQRKRADTVRPVESM